MGVRIRLSSDGRLCGMLRVTRRPRQIAELRCRELRRNLPEEGDMTPSRSQRPCGASSGQRTPMIRHALEHANKGGEAGDRLLSDNEAYIHHARAI